MILNKTRTLFAIALLSLFLLGTAQASNRWDVLQWCTTNTQAEIARCDGFLNAAVDLRTSDDFAGAKSCFLPGTRLPDIRLEVIAWLKENKTVPEKSGLALVARAIRERFPCPD